MGSKYFQPKALTLGQQMAKMAALFPRFQCEWRRGKARWLGPVKPSGVSEEYRVRVEYGLGESPKVWVLSPSLRARDGCTSIPHTYPGPRPCLFLPGSGEWRPDHYISDTIIPWTSLWLFHYEVWQATGQWLGRGIHPQAKEPKNKKEG